MGGAYLDAKYVEFKDAPFYLPVAGPPYGNTAAVLGDASGNRLAQVPRWRFTAGVDYDFRTPIAAFDFNVNTAYTGAIYWDADNILKQGGYALLNASLTSRLPDNDRWSVMLWGKNLTGREYYSIDLTEAGSSGDIAAPAAPRTFGVEFGYKL